MDFDLTDEQRLLKDSVERMVADRYGFEQRRAYLANPLGRDPALWAQCAELGLLGLPLPEEYGGFGGGPVETMLVMEAFGRALVLEPYLSSVILGGALVLDAGNAAQKQAILPALAEGRMQLAFAHLERRARYDLADVATTARAVDGGFVLDGAKGVVLGGDTADRLIVSARISGARSDAEGIGLFLVAADAPGLGRRGNATQDGLRAAEISLAATPGEPLGTPGAALAVMRRVVDRAIAALCAEAVGVMTAMHETTLEYLKTRKQFGRAIGEFQALQHRAVDMLVALEQARSMALFATVMADNPDAAERGRAMAAAKAQIGRSGRHIGQEAIQLHGGIGMTMEYKVGHYFKRMTMIDQCFGDADTQLARLADAGSLFAAV